MTVEERWKKLRYLIRMSTMPAAVDKQIAAARDLALEVLDECMRAVGGHPPWHERDPIGPCPFCRMLALRARIAALPAGEGSG